MQRGSRSIYKNLFNEPVAETTATLQPSLRTQKIDCIIDYYYYTGRKEIIINGKPVQMSYASLMEIVSGVFFLSTFTLHDIIQNNMDKVALVKQEWKGRTVKELQKSMAQKWPQFVW